MRLLASLALLLGVFQLGVLAELPPKEPPTCGAICIQQEAMKSDCGLDVTCVCTNVELQEKISLCVKKSCSVRDSLLLQAYSKHSCGAPTEDRTQLVMVIGVVFLALGLLGFGLRVMARVVVGTQTWGADDWVMLLAVAMMVPLNGLSVKISKVGLGKDIWTVEPDQISEFLYLFYWDCLLYLGVLPITKISILLFYLKVFPGRNIRRACWIFIGLNVAYFIAFELVSIFQCSPIDGAWKAWDKEYPAKCNNVNMQGWAAAVINIFLDVGTLVIPLKELYRLSLSGKKKVQLMLMFSIGIFVTVVSAVRLQSLASYATTDNATQDYVEVGYWSTIEVPVGIICACMPAIRSLFGTVFPRVFGTTNKSSEAYAVSHNTGQLPRSHIQDFKGLPNLSNGVGAHLSGYSRQDDSSVIELTDVEQKDFEDRQWEGRKPTVPSEFPV